MYAFEVERRKRNHQSGEFWVEAGILVLIGVWDIKPKVVGQTIVCIGRTTVAAVLLRAIFC